MKPRTEMATWAAALALGVAAWLVAQRSNDAPLFAQQALAVGASMPPDARDVRAAAAEVVTANPFRLDREPAAIAFVPNADRIAQAPPTVAQPPKPQLLLRAVVGGPPWQAMIDGIPGKAAGSLVNAGDRIGGLIIVTINKDMVIVQGMDTTWRLGVARPWQ